MAHYEKKKSPSNESNNSTTAFEEVETVSTQDRVKESVAHFQESASHKVEQAREAIGEGVKYAGVKAEAAREAAIEGLTALDKRTRSFVEEYPFAALGIAIGAGFFIGRLVARR